MHGMPQSPSVQQLADGTHWQDPRPHRPDGQGKVHEANGVDLPQASLERTLEAEIIPRLVRAHQRERWRAAAAPGLPAAGVSANHIEAFVRLVLAADSRGEIGIVEALRSNGASFDMLCEELLTPAARRLGDLWSADLCDFAQVTMGLWRLQQLLREFRPLFPSEIDSRDRGLRALLVPVPGEEHTLGLAMVTEFFLRAGWQVSGSPPASVDQLRQAVRADWFDVAGLAISCETRVRLLAQSIGALRQASRNPDIRVLVGGPLFVQRPELVAFVGADATATAARQAPAHAEQLLATPGRTSRA